MKAQETFRPNGHAPILGGVAARVAATESEHWHQDSHLLDKLVALLVHDQKTLAACSGLLEADDFKPVRGMPNGRARWLVAERALEHFERHREPLGKLLRADVLQQAESLAMGASQVAELREYVKTISGITLDAPDAITEKVIRFKTQRLQTDAIDKLSELQASGLLTPEKWDEINQRVVSSRGTVDKTEALPAQWPEPLRPEAFYGLAGDIVQSIEPHTEAHPAAMLAQTLVAFGSVIGRGPHWMHGATRHALNLFTGIVGDTGTGKGSGLDQVMDIFRDVDLEWGRNPNMYAGLASGEGFIHMVRDPVSRRKKDGELAVEDPGVEDKRLLLVQPEFAQVLQVLERQGNTLATKLRNAWDGKPLANNSLSSHLTATDAHISLVVHSTSDDLRDLMRRTMILNGFGNRFLWVCSRRMNAKPFGGVLPETDRTALLVRLRDAVEFANGLKQLRRGGRMVFGRRATNLWVSAYNTTLARDSENPTTGRAMPQVRRIACIYALMDCAEWVREEHLSAALETWRYCADSARFIFGGVRKSDPVAEKALDALRANRAGLTRKEIYINVFSGNKSADEITRVLQSLLKQGQARVRSEAAGAKGGRPAERWFAV